MSSQARAAAGGVSSAADDGLETPLVLLAGGADAAAEDLGVAAPALGDDDLAADLCPRGGDLGVAPPAGDVEVDDGFWGRGGLG